MPENHSTDLLADAGPTLGLIQHASLRFTAMYGRSKLDSLVDALEIPHPLIAPTGTRIPLLKEAAFFEKAAESCGDIDFGFLSCITLSIATSLPAYISERSRTVRDALTDACRFVQQVRPGMDFQLEERGNVASVHLQLTNPLLHDYPRHREAMFAGVIGQLRAFTARPFLPEHLSFRHAREPIGREARSGIGCSVAFDAEATELLLGIDVLDREIKSYDDGLRSVLISHAEYLEKSASDSEMSFVERVELYVQKTLRESVPSVETAARDLGVSRRTLARRLNEAETTFADILFRVRFRIAAHELQATDTPISVIAQKLGYSSPSAFSSVFHKVTGLTPRDFRSGKIGNASSELD